MAPLRRQRTGAAARLEAAGDRLMAQGKAKQALRKFLAAEVLEHQRPELYGKLIAAHQAAGAADAAWDAHDLAQSLGWEMRRQELEHPAVRATHERLAPAWGEVTELLRRLFVASDETTMEALIAQITAYQGQAVRPLLDFLLLLKAGLATTVTPPPPDAPATPEATSP